MVVDKFSKIIFKRLIFTLLIKCCVVKVVRKVEHAVLVVVKKAKGVLTVSTPFASFAYRGLSFQHRIDLLHGRAKRCIGIHLILDRFAGMQNGGMVFLSHHLSDQ